MTQHVVPCRDLPCWRHLRAHGVVAAVDMEQLSGRHVEVVREQGTGGPADRAAVLQAPAERRTLLPHLLEILEARDAAGGQGGERAGADRVGRILYLPRS